MLKAKIKIKSSKSGTKIADSKVRVAQTDKKQPKEKPKFQTRAQLNVHIVNKKGNARSKHR